MPASCASAQAQRHVGRRLAACERGRGSRRRGPLRHHRQVVRHALRHAEGRLPRRVDGGADRISSMRSAIASGRAGRHLRRRGQRPLHRVQHELVHGRRLAEAHLDLGRVHVDVHAPRIDLQAQAVHRLARAVQHVGVGGAHRVRQHLVAHVAAVDVEVLRIGPRAARGRQSDPAADAQSGGRGLHLALRLRELLGQQAARALARGLRGQREDRLAVVHHRERDGGMRGRQPHHLRDAVAELGGFGAQELAPRRRLVEEVDDLDPGADQARRRRDVRSVAADREGRVRARHARRDGRRRRRRRSTPAPRRGTRATRRLRGLRGWRSCWWRAGSARARVRRAGCRRRCRPPRCAGCRRRRAAPRCRWRRRPGCSRPVP